MRVLITGGAGFIGSHLADMCIQRGYRVCVLDDFSSGSLSNISHLVAHPRFSHTVGSIEDEELVGKLMDGCDEIYHVAAAVGMRLTVHEPLRTLAANVRGTETVLAQAAKRHKRVLFTSTSEIYGVNEHKPSRESDHMVMGTMKSRWAYACSKAIDEFFALAYYQERKLPIIVVRLFNTVGPRQTGRYGMVIPTFVKQALRGEPLTVHGTGMQTRCFAAVGEVVRGMIALMREPRAVGDVFNIGSNEEVSILELAQRVKTLTGSRSEITFMSHDVAYEKGFEEVMRRVPDISKINNLVGYAPKKTLDEILLGVIDQYEKEPAVV